jgi:GAF domain-containing protein
MSPEAPKRRRRAPRAGTGGATGRATDRLQQALTTAASSAELRRGDHMRLLEAIVSTAARVIDASAGSLMLLDAEANELEFQVAIGPGSEQVKQFRVPLGQGIAGFTASTGQALAIADTSQDTRFARQIAEGTGYVPKTLLCVPLMLRGEVIGVMELLDKHGGTIPFTPTDTAVLASFGEQAALTIDLSLQAQSLERLLVSAAAAQGDEQLSAEARRAAENAAKSPGYDRSLGLARQVAAIGAAGERESRLAAAVLQALTDYLTDDPSAGLEMSTGLLPGAF